MEEVVDLPLHKKSFPTCRLIFLELEVLLVVRNQVRSRSLKLQFLMIQRQGARQGATQARRLNAFIRLHTLFYLCELFIYYCAEGFSPALQSVTLHRKLRGRIFSSKRNFEKEETDQNSGPVGGVAFPPINEDAQTESVNGSNATENSSYQSVLASVLALNPSEIEIVTVNALAEPIDPNVAEQLRHLPFVSMFRGSANYIANHRNTLAVYHIPGGLLDLDDPAIFRNLMNDIALTWLLGMKVVLVVGCRHQIEKRLNEKHRVAGIRVTDKDTLRVVKEEAGYVRFEVERELARGLRLQSSGMDGNVVSGNFYSAQPLGILDGVDYE